MFATTRRQPRRARGMHAPLAPGGAARLPLGLDTRRRTGEGRTARGDVGGAAREKLLGGR
jgi:hypothetical protein